MVSDPVGLTPTLADWVRLEQPQSRGLLGSKQKTLMRALAMRSILADVAVGISELEKNPSAVIVRAGGMPVALLNDNRAIAYLDAGRVVRTDDRAP